MTSKFFLSRFSFSQAKLSPHNYSHNGSFLFYCPPTTIISWNISLLHWHWRYIAPPSPILDTPQQSQDSSIVHMCSPLEPKCSMPKLIQLHKYVSSKSNPKEKSQRMWHIHFIIAQWKTAIKNHTHLQRLLSRATRQTTTQGNASLKRSWSCWYIGGGQTKSLCVSDMPKFGHGNLNH